MRSPRQVRRGRVAWVWTASPDAPTGSEVLLTAEERERCSLLVRSADRARFLSAHVLARVAVADQLGVDAAEVALGATCARCGGAHGRPEVRAPARTRLHLSLAHAGNRVVVAVALRPVGVDVEPLGAAPPSVADVALSARERYDLEHLPAADQGDALSRWWVSKEAVLKAAGVGLAVDPRRVEVPAPWHARGRARLPGSGRYRLAHLDVGADHVAAVALAGRRAPQLVVREVDLTRWG